MKKEQYDLIMGAVRERITYFEKQEAYLQEGYDGDTALRLTEAKAALEARFKNESFN